MADDVVAPAIGASIATDDIGGRHFQRVKVTHGADGTATDVSAASPLPVDSELPAAAALTDTVANPTTPSVGAAGLIWNGATWSRAKQAPAADAQAVTGIQAVAPMRFNGTTWDRPQGLLEGVALASAARTAATSAPTVLNTGGFAGVLITIDVTVVPGLGGIRPRLQLWDGVAWIFATPLSVVPTDLTANGRYGYLFAPGVPSLNAAPSNTYTNFSHPTYLPYRWRVTIGVATADSYTYSVQWAYVGAAS